MCQVCNGIGFLSQEANITDWKCCSCTCRPRFGGVNPKGQSKLHLLLYQLKPQTSLINTTLFNVFFHGDHAGQQFWELQCQIPWRAPSWIKLLCYILGQKCTKRVSTSRNACLIPWLKKGIFLWLRGRIEMFGVLSYCFEGRFLGIRETDICLYSPPEAHLRSRWVNARKQLHNELDQDFCIMFILANAHPHLNNLYYQY